MQGNVCVINTIDCIDITQKGVSRQMRFAFEPRHFSFFSVVSADLFMHVCIREGQGEKVGERGAG